MTLETLREKMRIYQKTGKIPYDPIKSFMEKSLDVISRLDEATTPELRKKIMDSYLASIQDESKSQVIRDHINFVESIGLGNGIEGTVNESPSMECDVTPEEYEQQRKIIHERIEYLRRRDEI